jgi:hypothetical protein
MKSIIPTIAALLLGTSSIAFAQVKLTFNPAQKATYEYATELDMNIAQTVMGQAIPMNHKMKFLYQLTVLERSGERIKIRCTYTQMQLSSSSPSPMVPKISFDSRTPNYRTPMDSMVSVLLGSFIGKSYVVEMSPSGTVQAIAGMKEMLGGMSQSNPMLANMTQMFSDDALKQSLEQSFRIYPEKPVNIGDSWDVKQAISMNGMSIDNVTTYTLSALKNGIATLDIKSKMDYQLTTPVEGTLRGNTSGSMDVDSKTGLPTQSVSTMKMSGKFSAQGMDVENETTATTKISVVEMK